MIDNTHEAFPTPDFMKEQALNRRLNAILAFFLAFAVAMFTIDWISGYIWANRNIWSSVLAIVAILAAIPAFKIFTRLFDQQIRRSRFEENGAAGERDFVKFLKDLPDAYTVI